MLFLSLLAPLLQLAAASPAPGVAAAGLTDVLGKRGDGSGVHLVNCDPFSGEGTVLPPSSHVIVRLYTMDAQLLSKLSKTTISFG